MTDYQQQATPGLDRMHSALALLGNPHLRLPPVFHVAGTNGKGSTIAFLQAIFENAGKSVHRYTSPHLIRFEERIAPGGKPIAPDTLLQQIEETRTKTQTIPLSLFQFFTCLAFLSFSRQNADVVLLETGIGGRLDATNVIPAHAASIITRISFDHTHILGNTLEKIASEKAGIFRAGRPAIIAPQPSASAGNTLHAQARDIGANLHDWSVTPATGGFIYKSDRREIRLPRPKLAGDHQITNAGCAIAGLEAGGYDTFLSPDILSRAMDAVRWPGRLQRVTSGRIHDLLPEGWDFWVDGSHNDSGAETLLSFMDENWRDDRPLYVLTAYKDNKSLESFYAPLKNHIAKIITLPLPAGTPVVPHEKLAQDLRGAGLPASASPDLETAVKQLTFSYSSSARIMVTGSLYLAGYALRINQGNG